VYHQSAGEFVNEDSPTEPSRFSGKALLKSEQLAQHTWPGTVAVRFAGIYGPGRLRLIRKVQSGEPVAVDPPRYTNRIFRDDCVHLLAFLMEKTLQGVALDPVYIGCDDAPVTDIEVLDFIAERMGVSKLPRISSQDGPVNQNKRCSNQRIRALGYRLLYPSYREGYERILEEAGLLKS
jgi:nucleoside-diphosphate-sugar epimerase